MSAFRAEFRPGGELGSAGGADGILVRTAFRAELCALSDGLSAGYTNALGRLLNGLLRCRLLKGLLNGLLNRLLHGAVEHLSHHSGSPETNAHARCAVWVISGFAH